MAADMLASCQTKGGWGGGGGRGCGAKLLHICANAQTSSLTLSSICVGYACNQKASHILLTAVPICGNVVILKARQRGGGRVHSCPKHQRSMSNFERIGVCMHSYSSLIGIKYITALIREALVDLSAKQMGGGGLGRVET